MTIKQQFWAIAFLFGLFTMVYGFAQRDGIFVLAGIALWGIGLVATQEGGGGG